VIPALLITGPVGVGKTSVGNELSEQLEAAELPHALFDLDSFATFFPRPEDDPFGQRVALQALERLWPLYQDAGAARVVLVRVLESRDELASYAAAIPGLDVTVVRLAASAEANAERIRRRENGSGLEWSVARAAELAALLEAAQVEDVLVQTTGRRVPEIAREILRLVGWLDPVHG
jgi:adenylylsulfate kinase